MIVGLLLCGAGLFSVAGAIYDCEFFMSHYRARLFVRLMGRKGARVFYAILGLFLLGVGVADMAGLLPTR